MIGREKPLDVIEIMRSQWIGQPMPPASLLEQRVLEMEDMGLLDEEDMPGIPSSVRQFAIASLMHSKPSFFVTYDDELLEHREELEFRYGLRIFSVPEALLLLQEDYGPPN